MYSIIGYLRSWGLVILIKVFAKYMIIEYLVPEGVDLGVALTKGEPLVRSLPTDKHVFRPRV